MKKRGKEERLGVMEAQWARVGGIFLMDLNVSFVSFSIRFITPPEIHCSYNPFYYYIPTSPFKYHPYSPESYLATLYNINHPSTPVPHTIFT